MGFDPQTGDNTTHQLADRNVNSSSYDSMHRLRLVSYFDGSSVTYTYTPTGQRPGSNPRTDSRGVTSCGL